MHLSPTNFLRFSVIVLLVVFLQSAGAGQSANETSGPVCFRPVCCFVYSFDCLQAPHRPAQAPPREGRSGAGRVWFPAWPAIYRLLFLHKRILFSSASQGRRFPNQFGTGSPALSRAIITRPGLAAHTQKEKGDRPVVPWRQWPSQT